MNCSENGSLRTLSPYLVLLKVQLVLKLKLAIITFVGACFGFLMSSSRAATIRVPYEQDTIQHAINAAIDGDLILVSPGIYFERINYWGKAISIQSTNGPGETIMDGQKAAGAVVTFQNQETAASVLAGFTIQHGIGSGGSGVELYQASPTITANVFRENNWSIGVIFGNISSPIIEGNLFLANECDTFGVAGVVVLLNESSPLIVNNVFARNPCQAINMTLPFGNHPVIANNTIVQNRVGIRVFAGIPTASQLYANNILFGNEVGFEMQFGSATNAPTWINNLVFGNTTDYLEIADQTGLNGNISSDPMFLSTRSRNDFELEADSPAIDAGTLSIPGLPPLDFLRKPRVVDGNGDGSALPDIGAYEFHPPSEMPEMLTPSAMLDK